MSRFGLILIAGETDGTIGKSGLISLLKEGISSIPHFDAIKLNALLPAFTEPVQLSDHCCKFTSPEATVYLLQCPSIIQILDCFEGCLTPLPQQVCLAYAGKICQSTGHWVLSDAVVQPSHLIERISAISKKVVQTLADEAKSALPSVGIHVAFQGVPSGGDWRHVLATRLPPTLAGRPLNVSVNQHHLETHAKKNTAGSKSETASLPSDTSGLEAFCQRLETIIVEPVPPTPSSPSSRSNGASIRIQRPCLYVFPEGSGQSAIFALPGFSMMVNAGVSRDPRCWKMAQHLENIDALLQTHWGIDNTFGLTSLLPAMVQSDYGPMPKVTCLLVPPPGSLIGHAPLPTVNTNNDTDHSVLVVNVAKAMNEFSHEMKQYFEAGRLVSMEVGRGTKMAAMPKAVPLYYRAGFGSLDLYPLTPSDEDQSEVKKLTDMWSKNAAGFASALVGGASSGASSVKAAVSKVASTLVSQLSVSALLVWKPVVNKKAGVSSPTLRLLFVSPNAHQARVLAALDYLHTGMTFLRHADPDAKEAPATSAGAAKRGTATPAVAASTRPVSASHKPGLRQNGSLAAASKPSAAAKPTTAPKRPVAAAATTSAKPRSQLPMKSTAAAASVSSKKPAASGASAKPQTAGAPKTKAQAVEPTHSTDPPATSPQALEPASNPPPEAFTNSVHDDEAATPTYQPEDVDAGQETQGDESGASKHRVPLDAGDGAVPHDARDEEDEQRLDKSEFALDDTGVDGVDDPPAPDPLVNWEQPQAMPPPVAPTSTKTAAKVGSSAGPASPPEGYYDASLAIGKAPYDKLKTSYVDVAFLPGAGGDVSLLDAEFFKHLRSRYYVATTAVPTSDLLKSVVVGKEAWAGEGGASAEVSLILSHDTDELLQWASVNEQRLRGNKIDLMTVAERSTIQLVAPEGDNTAGGFVCPGFRLDL